MRHEGDIVTLHGPAMLLHMPGMLHRLWERLQPRCGRAATPSRLKPLPQRQTRSPLWRWCVLFTCLWAGLAGPACALSLPELMTLLSARRSGEARFTEQREVALLSAPLVSSGTLSFEAPDRFVRRTLQPRPETMAVQGNTLTLTRGGKTRQFTLDAAPEAVAIVEAVRGTLTGNAAALQKHFRTQVEGRAERWSMLLQPLGTTLAHQVREIRLEGERGDLREVTVEMRDGDRSVMQIEPLSAKP